jgi:hypothetical protein
MTGSTFTATALMPSGMAEGRPAPAPSGASFPSSTGSRGDIGTTTPRPRRSFGSKKQPSSTEALGQGTTSRCSGASRVPRGSFFAATTTIAISLLSRDCKTR